MIGGDGEASYAKNSALQVPYAFLFLFIDHSADSLFYTLASWEPNN